MNVALAVQRQADALAEDKVPRASITNPARARLRARWVSFYEGDGDEPDLLVQGNTMYETRTGRAVA